MCYFVSFVVYGLSMMVAGNIENVRERIAAAAQKAGRGIEDITLMAVSKTFPPELIREAYQLQGFGSSAKTGYRNLPKRSSRSGICVDAEWHMIGHLQTNKASKAVELFTAMDGVDSLRLAQKLNDSARTNRKKLKTP